MSLNLIKIKDEKLFFIFLIECKYQKNLFLKFIRKKIMQIFAHEYETQLIHYALKKEKIPHAFLTCLRGSELTAIHDKIPTK
jgi:hypothetical protein